MKFVGLLIAAFVALAPAAYAQPVSPPSATSDGGIAPQVGVTPTPIVINQAAAPAAAPPPTGSIVDIGGVFGPIIEPYVNSLVGLILSSLCGWILLQVKTKLGINIDQAQADTYLRAAKNQASSLVADGFVQIEKNGKVTVDNEALAAAANDLLKSVPAAAAHFTLTNKPDVVAAKIIDMIPQVPAHAAATQAAASVATAADNAAAKVADAPDTKPV